MSLHRCFAPGIIRPAVSGETLIVRDFFTVGSDGHLEDHTPTELGDSWVKQFTTGAFAAQMHVIAASDHVEHNPARGEEGSVKYCYTSRPQPSVADYRVKATLTIAPSGDNGVWVCARVADGNNYYAAGGIQGNRRLILNSAGTISVLDTDGGSFSNGDVFELICTDSEKTFKINDSTIFTDADNTLTGTGQAGIAAGNLDDDNFPTWDIGDPGDWAFDTYEVFEL